MDENLNDIGTLNFRQRKLELQAVSFEQDVLCLGYVESSTVGLMSERQKYNTSKHTNSRDELLFQFINLSGKVIAQYATPVTLAASQNYGTGLPVFGRRVRSAGW